MRSDSVEEGKKYAITTLYFDYASDMKGLQKKHTPISGILLPYPKCRFIKKLSAIHPDSLENRTGLREKKT